MAVNIAIQEVGGNVVWTATGTLNLGGLTYASTQSGGGIGFDANTKAFGSGLASPNVDLYNGSITLPSAFGTGGGAGTSAIGSYIGIFGIPSLYVPAGYVSGAALSGVTTYNSTTLATLGLTVGTYVYSWGSGGNADTLTLSIGAQPTPTPTITQTQTSTPTPTATLPPAPSTVEITSNNYSGQTADITFYPCSGGTISLGSQVIPYNFQTTYYYGQYSLYFSAYNSTCTYDIVCPSPTPTTTSTPTVTPTNTPTPTSASTPTGFTVNVSQVGPNVVWSGSGSFNLTDLTLNQNLPGVTGGYNKSFAQFVVGSSSPVNATTYSGSSFTTFPANFGSGSGTPPSSSSGSIFGVVQTSGTGGPREVLVPQGYTSGTEISGSMTYNSQTIAGMGLTPGTYTWSWGTGGNTSTIVMTISS
jgi:hypothetical protein